MAEEQIYDQVEQGGDPDPLGLRRKATTKADPLGLRQRVSAPKQSFQVQLSGPSFGSKTPSATIEEGTVISESGVPAKKEFAYTKPTDVLAAEKLQGKAAKAHENLQVELKGNRDVKEKMIRQRRFDEFSEQIPISRTDMPKVQSALDVDRIIERPTKPQDLPVTEDDLIKEDEAIQTDRGKAVRLLEETMKSRPEKAKDIQKNVYLIDAFNSLNLTPEVANERAAKIEENAKQLAKGNLIYDPRSNRLIKPLGLMGSFLEGWKQDQQLLLDNDFLRNTENNSAILSEYHARQKEVDMDEPIPVPKGRVSEVFNMLGSMPYKPLAAGAIASFGGPQAGLAAGAVVGGREVSKREYPATFWRTLDELIKDGVPEHEAVEKARFQAEQAAEIGAIVGGTSGLIGVRSGLQPIKQMAASNSFRQAAFNVLKTSGNELGKAGLEGLAAGGIGAAGEIYKNKLAQEAGIKRDITEGVAEQIEGNLLMTVGMAAAIKAGRGMSKMNYRTLLHGISKLPDEQINGWLQNQVESGTITQDAADQGLARINEYKQKDSQIPPNVTEEARFKIQDNIDKLNELEAQKESTHKSLQEPIKEKIQKLEEQNLSLLKETEKPEKPESGLTKSQEKEAIETAEEFLAEGIFPEIYASEIKKDPIGFWKTIAQQAQNRDENWRPLSEQLDEQAVRDQFGDTVVDYAKELFPAPELSTENVSVIMPEDVKRPETITIKPKEEVSSEQTQDPVIIDETPEQVQANIPKEGQPTVQAESTPTGQEGEIGLPPTEETPKVGVYAERPPTQLSYRGLQDIANEFGYEDVVKRDKVSDIQERMNAEMTTSEWASKGEYQKNIDDLLKRIEDKEMVPTAKQRLILEQYIANEKEKLRNITDKFSPEYDAQLNKVRKLKQIGQIARGEAGAALRIPDGGSLPHPILDEESAMIAKMEANAVDNLTDQQKQEVLSQVEEYKQANDEANARIAQLEEQVAKLDAEKEFKKAKSVTKKTKKTTEERVAYRKSEIEAAREALKKLRSGESGLSAVPLPGVRELMAIAPHVKNIMVDLIEQGATELGEVIKKIHDEFNDVLEGVTEKDIHDIIAGKYNEKRKPLSALQAQIRDLQDEAKLINQLESLLNGKEPKEERAKRQRNQKIKDLKDKIKDFRKEERESNKFNKEELDSDAKKLIAIKKRNDRAAQELKDKISRGEFEKEEKQSIFDREDIKRNYPNLRKDALDAISKKEDARHEFDLALFEDERSRWSTSKKLLDFVAKLVHTSKSIMAGIDDSATFVQNGLAMLSNPKIGAKVWVKHWREAFNEKRFKRELEAIHQSPDWDVMQKSGLDVVEQVSDAAKKAEEAFEQNLLAGKFKIGEKEYQPWKYTGGIFERAFASMGNNMRVELFRKRVAQLLADKKTFESNPQDYKDAARVINEMTGRGKQNKYLEQASPAITPFIWAPRMLASTFNLLGISDIASYVGGSKIGTEGYYRTLTPAQRRFALTQVGRGIAVGVGIMGAAALGGAKVDYDPFSVTFGDVIIGPHHYNVFGRFMPVVKTIVQAASGRRDTKSGIKDLDNPKTKYDKTRGEVVESFFRGKVTPAVGTALNLWAGKDYFTHEEFGIKDVPKSLLQPMAIKDLIEGWKNDGTWGILNRFLPAFEGLKATDERDFKKLAETSSSGGKSQKPGKPKKPTKNTKN